MGSSSNLRWVCLFMFLFSWVANVHCTSGVFNVLDCGAVADGKTDNAKPFLNAWNQACSWNGKDGKARVLIPYGTYLSGPVSFKGPCKGPIVFQLQGIVKAPVDLTSDSWITYEYITGLTIAGRGTFDGQGTLAWSLNECSKGRNCNFPISIRFNFVTDATIRGISSVDSKLFHINILGCKNMKLQSIKISAPGTSINTDGIHIGRSTGIKISRSVIGTGDDCISLGPGSSNISISNVYCGPGHGISVGSLGKYEKEEAVFGITVKNCTFTGTDNGVRIKTWPSSPFGIASNFTFEDIVMKDVRNPIIIDQQYCPYAACNLESPSKVKISNVRFKNISGTSTSKLAVNLLCSQGVPCQGVEIGDISLKYTGEDGAATSVCSNVKAILSGKQIPPTCV